MIGIQNTIKDSIGTVWLSHYQVTGPYEINARVNRVKTLDGGTAFSHFGVSHTDRDLIVDCRLGESDQARIKTFFESGSELLISFWEGGFIGLINSLRIARDGVARITFVFKEKLS